jgi:hypothetical protein
MQITSLSVYNFKSIDRLVIEDIDRAMILVGRNSVGKTAILDAIRLAAGDYIPTVNDFHHRDGNIEITLTLRLEEEDLRLLNQYRRVSRFRHFEAWYKDFCEKLPSFVNGELSFCYVVNRKLEVRYEDGFKKNNTYIPMVLPKIYFISHDRNVEEIQNDIFLNDRNLKNLIGGTCMFDKAKECTSCYQCIGMINKKTPQQMNVHETALLMQYKLMKLGDGDFIERLNRNFHKNGGVLQDVQYDVRIDVEGAFSQGIFLKNKEREIISSIDDLGDGMRSIYALSLLETYTEDDSRIPSIIVVEDPEIYLHPQLQKVASEILYRLSRKNQVIFSTHSPNLIFNFNSRQIKQVVLDENCSTMVSPNTDIDVILNDLGYSANDLMNVSFVFIVEGKQDSSRLPMLLKKYYGEIYDAQGNLQRVAIIATNSCTNIKTYANLKYINKLYLKDQFLMIRDGDGKDPDYLKRQLCSYYAQRAKEDYGNLPRVRESNVLILKYYSFENYFLDPKVMTQIGVVKSEQQFYDILWNKYQEYLYKLSSVRKMQEKLGITISSRKDIVDNMENIRIYVRGHNLFDIFYGRYKGKKENEILTKYIEAAPRETFDDILKSIDRFVFFESKKSDKKV